MADITPPLPEGRQLIQSYGGGGFRIAGRDYTGSVLVQAERTLAWPVSDAAAIDRRTLRELTQYYDAAVRTGGFAVGILENLAGGLIDPKIAEITPYIILLGVLIFRPEGLFGLKRIERI